jgi:hypothetical protein
MASEPTCHVRHIGGTPVADGVWDDLLDAIARWRSHGAPYRAMCSMLEDDYGLAFDEATVRLLAHGIDDGDAPGN